MLLSTYRTVGPSYLSGFRQAAVADECLFDGLFYSLSGVFQSPMKLLFRA